MLELVGDSGGYGCGRENNLLNGIENINKQSRVGRSAKVKSVSHDVVNVMDKRRGKARLAGTEQCSHVTWLVSKPSVLETSAMRLVGSNDPD